MKQFILGLTLIGCFALLQAQTPPLKTISEIKTTRSAADDTSALHGQKVQVEGIVMNKPTDWWQYDASANNYVSQIWIQDPAGNGPKSGLIVRKGNKTDNPVDFNTLAVGTQAVFTGTVGYFQGDIQLNLDTTTSPQLKGLGKPLGAPVALTVGTLNDMNSVAQPSGEQWTGTFAELTNLEITSRSTSQPVRFAAKDAAGNVITIILGNLKPTRNYVPPAVGTSFTKITGIVTHFISGTTNTYQLMPLDTSALEIGSAVPSITNVTRNPVCPKPTESVTVTATVTHPVSLTEVDKVELFYATQDVSNPTYTTVQMTAGSAGTYTASIPAQAAGTFVHYHVVVTGKNGKTNRSPGVNRYLNYVVNPNGCEIVDIQYYSDKVMSTNFREFESGYRNLTVNDVKGVVTASTADLGYVYIQQPGKSSWAGIELIGSAANTLQLGDSVSVNGTVREWFGHTRIEVSTVNTFGKGSTITPVVITDPALFADGAGSGSSDDSQTSFKEQYEGMLVKVMAPNLQVVDTAPDYIGGLDGLKGDYRVGTNLSDPKAGVRILAGRQSNSLFSSLNVSLVNSLKWQDTDGRMNVDPCVVTRAGGSTPDGTKMDAIQGIMVWQWNRFKMTPRNNSDLFNVQRPDCRLVSVADVYDQTSLTLYPNPTAGNVTLRRQTSNTTNWQVSVRDMAGREIMQTVMASDKAEIELATANLCAGVYLVTATNGVQNFSARLVVNP